MTARRLWTPASTRLLQLAASLLVTLYMLFIGGTFAATLVYQVKLLNFLAGGGLVLLWLLLRLKQGRPLRATGLEMPLLAFVASQCIAVIASAAPRLGLDWAASLFVWLAALVMLADLLANGWPRAYWLNALLVLALILAADGVWSIGQWFAHWAALRLLPPVAFRYDGLLEQANLAACVINLLWPLVLVRGAQAGRRVARLALFGLAAILLAVEFFTSSRAGWIAAAASIVTMAGLLALTSAGRQLGARALAGWRGQPRMKRLGALVVALVLLAGLAWLLLKETQQVTHGALFQSRDTFWNAAWSLFVAHPLTGSGPELFPWYYPRFVSIPPEFFPPSAHSVVMQILSGSGLLGLAALLALALALARRLWQQWLAAGRSLEAAGLAAALVSFGVHSLFDYPVTILILLLLVIVAALALAPVDSPDTAPSSGAARRGVHPAAAIPFVALPIAAFAFILRGAAGNAAGLALADRGQWQAAGAQFEQTANWDPGLTLYWEEAAYADTRAGALSAALPIWQRAARDDPYWALLPANIGAIANDLTAAQTARNLAPASHLFALNAGAVAETVGDQAAARQAYQNALDLKPSIAAALFWQQTPLRSGVLAGWQASHVSADTSAFAQAQAALARGDAAGAIPLFQQAQIQAPASNAPYLGLVRAYLQTGNDAQAERYLQAGFAIPVVSVEDSLGLLLAAGDLAEARGDRPTAIQDYNLVFSEVDDYDIAGPGSYGFPQRSRIIFHELALPGEIVPQMAHADITAEMDSRFAQLAQWQLDAGQRDAACHILERVHREAPASTSGRLYGARCGAT